METKPETLEHSVIVVNHEPYCIWDVGLKNRNIEFIKTIDSEYFDYIAKIHADKIDSPDDKRASVALRVAYHHALETLFSLIGAFVQAPECVFAWMIQCKTNELKDFVGRINRHDKEIFNKLNVDDITWESVASTVFAYYEPGSTENKKMIGSFGKLWERLANAYLDEKNTSEYNSLKHGFRISPGGFALSVGIEHQYGVPPPAAEMQTIGGCKHGSAFYILERVAKSRSLIAKQISLNWRIESVVTLLELISMSIQNIVSALKLVNGLRDGIKFVVPEEDDAFDKAWSYSAGVNNLCLSLITDELVIPPTTKKELDEVTRKYLSDRQTGKHKHS
jgi:hypothetical protein